MLYGYGQFLQVVLGLGAEVEEEVDSAKVGLEAIAAVKYLIVWW